VRTGKPYPQKKRVHPVMVLDVLYRFVRDPRVDVMFERQLTLHHMPVTFEIGMTIETVEMFAIRPSLFI